MASSSAEQRTADQLRNAYRVERRRLLSCRDQFRHGRAATPPLAFRSNDPEQRDRQFAVWVPIARTIRALGIAPRDFICRIFDGLAADDRIPWPSELSGHAALVRYEEALANLRQQIQRELFWVQKVHVQLGASGSRNFHHLLGQGTGGTLVARFCLALKLAAQPGPDQHQLQQIVVSLKLSALLKLGRTLSVYRDTFGATWLPADVVEQAAAADALLHA